MPEARYVPAQIRTLPSWLLGRAAAHGHRLVGEALSELGLRMAHHAVLSAVAELAPLSQAELSRSLAIDPKDMVSIVNDLQAAELLARDPDPRDRRKNVITISAAGSQLLSRAEQLCERANEALTAELTGSEREQLSALLARIIPKAD